MGNGRKISPYALIFVTVVIDLIGFGIVIPILPLYSERFGANPTTIGLLLAAFPLAQFVFTPILGALSDRIGRRPVLAASVFGSMLAFCTMGSAQALWMLFAGRIIDGITGGNISTAQAYIADISPPEHRAKAVGIIGAGFGVGLVIGPMIGGVAAHVGPRVPFFVAAGLAMINCVAILLFLPEPERARKADHEKEPRMPLLHFRETISRHHLGLPVAVYVTSVLSMTMVYATFALFLKERFNLTESHVGYLFGTMGVIGVFCQLRLIGPAARHIGEAGAAKMSLFGMAVALVLMVVAPGFWWFLPALALYSVTNSFNNTMTLAIVSRQAPADIQGRVIGTAHGAASVARATGPIIAGVMFDHLSTGAPFLASAVVSAAAGLLALGYPRKLEQPSARVEQ